MTSPHRQQLWTLAQEMRDCINPPVVPGAPETYFIPSGEVLLGWAKSLERLAGSPEDDQC